MIKCSFFVVKKFTKSFEAVDLRVVAIETHDLIPETCQTKHCIWRPFHYQKFHLISRLLNTIVIEKTNIIIFGTYADLMKQAVAYQCSHEVFT